MRYCDLKGLCNTTLTSDLEGHMLLPMDDIILLLLLKLSVVLFSHRKDTTKQLIHKSVLCVIYKLKHLKVNEFIKFSKCSVQAYMYFEFQSHEVPKMTR